MNDWEKAYWDVLLSELPLSPESACSYFPERPSAMRYFFSDDAITPSLIDASLASGFRRCGDMWYRTNCPACQACEPYRIPVPAFSPSRNMKRLLKRNADVNCVFEPPANTAEKRELYLRYQHSQHYLRPAFESPEEKPFNPAEALEIMEFQMYCNPESTLEVTMRLDGAIIGFGIMDVGETASSLVYFVFDPDYDTRSLGTLNILKSIDWAARHNYDVVYLGYYIADHPKMSYKHRFQPAETRNGDHWDPFSPNP